MARRAKQENGAAAAADDGGARRSNGYDPAKVKAFKSRIENLYGELATERSEYMTRCKSIREDIKIVLDEAKEDGISKKEFKRVIEAFRLANKIENLRVDLESEEANNYDMLISALGGLSDLPLGKAAMAAHAGAAAA